MTEIQSPEINATFAAVERATARVRAALDVTPADYLAACCAQRGADAPEGSRYPLLQGHELPGELRAATWAPAAHPEVKAPAVAFRAEALRGVVGVVPLASLPPRQLVELRDTKGVGAVSACVHRAAVPMSLYTSETWLILGPHEGREVLWTFHPGEPIAPSRVAGDLDGAAVYVSRAIELGLTHAKVLG